MAELHVEQKERSAMPWLLAGLVVLALLFWWFLSRGDNDATLAMGDSVVATADSAAGMTDTGASMNAGPLALQQFDRYTRDQTTAAASHEFSANGLRQLADAIDAVARERNSGVDLQPRLAEVRARADAIQQDAAATDHALEVREAALLAANLIRDAHRDSAFARTSFTSVQQSAEAIDAKRPLLEQTEQVRQFFERASSSLRELYTRNN